MHPTRRSRLLAALSILAAGASALALLMTGRPATRSEAPRAPEPTAVRVVGPVREAVRLRAPSQGTVTPRTESDLVAEVSGRMVDVSPSLERQIASDARVDEVRRAARVAEARVLEAAAELEQAERDLERTRIVAPYDGRVRTQQIDVGQSVSRGQPLGRIYAVDYAEVRLPIPDEELAPPTAGIGVCGDWGDGGRVERAVLGGDALARAACEIR